MNVTKEVSMAVFLFHHTLLEIHHNLHKNRLHHTQEKSLHHVVIVINNNFT